MLLMPGDNGQEGGVEEPSKNNESEISEEIKIKEKSSEKNKEQGSKKDENEKSTKLEEESQANNPTKQVKAIYSQY